jgi:chromosome segregation ATPase
VHYDWSFVINDEYHLQVLEMLEKTKELLSSTDQNQSLIKARISAAKDAIVKSEKAIVDDQKILNAHQEELGKMKNLKIFLDAARETAKGSRGLVIQRDQSRTEKLKAELAEVESECEGKLRSITMLEAELVADEDTNNQLKQLLQDLAHVWESGNRPVSDKTCQTDL